MIDADLLLLNGLVRTFDSAHSSAEAVAVHGGRIIAVGSSFHLSGLRGRNTKIVNLKGKCLLPGFIDAHQHMLYAGLAARQVDLSPNAISSIEEMILALRSRAETTPSDTWIEGRGYHDARLAEHRNPTAADLDRAAPDHPLYIVRVCGHVMVLNTRALQLAGIGPDTPDPPGGTIERDPQTGEPTGVLRETAMSLLRRVVPPPTKVVLRQAILDGAAENLRRGITSVWEPSIEPDHLQVYREMDAAGELPLRVTMAHKKVLRSGQEVPLPSRFTGERLSLVAVKLFQDGGFGAATAALSAPYTNAPETTGQLVWSQDELNERARQIHEAGLRISIHAIGDAAIVSAMEAIAYAAPIPQERVRMRHRIEHCGLPLPPIPHRLAQLGIVPVVQPHFLWFDGDVYLKRVGAERSRWLYPIRTLIDHGLAVAGSSDGPVVPNVSPLLGAFAAITRRSKAGPMVSEAEAITISEALDLFTRRATYACGEEGQKGSIEPGKVADFVLLNEDPITASVERLPEISVEAVCVNGEMQWFG